jgi:putative ATPase
MAQPLAERMRPKTLDDYIGQKHLVGEGAVLRRMIDSGRISSFILWGPPGVGKTTLAQIIANRLETPFYTLSAVTSGVKDVRDVIDKARSNRFFSQQSPILFIDEIHRFSKSQQDREQVWEKVKEEIGEFESEVATMDKEKAEAEFGDVMFSLINAARLYKINPDNALEHTNQKFIRRFNYLEEHTIKQGRNLTDMTLEEMDAVWNEAKKKGL